MSTIPHKRDLIRRAATLLVLLSLASWSVQAQHDMSGGLVSGWNMTCMMLTPTLGTHMGIRTLAMMHTAMYDTVMAFERTYAPYHVTNTPPAGASEQAAASAAAYHVLYTVFTNAGPRATIQAYYDAQLAMISNGTSKTDGMAFGQSVAEAILLLRSTDGAVAALSTPHPDGTLPGEWRRTASGEPLAPGWGSVTPWAMSIGSQFDQNGPPLLTSQEYTDHYNFTRTVGETNSPNRSDEQSFIARFWEPHVPAKWNSLARDISMRESLSLAESARLFGLLSITLADSAISCWDMKYNHNFWRPETAIHLGDSDTNGDTVGDPAWQSYLPSPAFPEYVSGHSLTCASSAKLLELFFGTGNYTFQLSTMGMPETRTYDSFWEAAMEAGLSRIYAGIHFPFSNYDGLQAGSQLAQYIYDTLMTPTSPPQDLATGQLIPGLTNSVINLTAKDGYISTADGNSVYFWGLAPQGGEVQYPAPTIIANQGQTLTINLLNQLTVPVSLVFPGQAGVVASGGTPGVLAKEALPSGGTVSYTFTAGNAGTYTYHSGTRPELQIEMGLVGALIVRPAGFDASTKAGRKAYDHADTQFDHEFLFLLTEMDETIHDLVEMGRISEVDTTKWWPVYWFINGRTGPDTMLAAGASWLPTQPYDCMPMFHPGEKVLMRMIGGGRDPHPFHHHGNNSTIIARDGRLLQSAPGEGPDLGQSVFTIPVNPGETLDSLFSWTGEKLGWDMYGHSTNDMLEPYEYAPDHGKPFPTRLPNQQQLTRGMMYGGSPFLGTPGPLPPGEGGFNPANGFSFMWHSHAEKEICNNNLFPGGMLTMILIDAYTTNSMPMH